MVPELWEETKARLAAFLLAAAAVKNPVDLIASATPVQYRKTIEVVLGANEVDALIVLYISVSYEAWSLALWYLELLLLLLFEYQGQYSNRLKRDVYRGEEVERVPWTTSA